ncbi:MAG: AIR synthase family protein [Candidatus Glassbacteria bacterium]|nr:AIR synthase family protein [Candidatus Glassbacteria bacterium]
MEPFPSGKIPADCLERLLRSAECGDPRVIRGGIFGEDAAVIEFGDRYLLAKSDPITFATDRPGWYAVQVNANDIAAMGGTCRWFLATLLLPEGATDEETVGGVFRDISEACRELGVELVGGHTEVAHGLDRILVAGQMLGEATPETLCTKEMVRAGDRLLLTKGIAVEGTSLIARECRGKLEGAFEPSFIDRCAGFLYDPGISVVREAALAVETGLVHAMHDPTEGGLAGALYELASASHTGLVLDSGAVEVYPETRSLCDFLGLDPLGLIASGSLLIACPAEGEEVVRRAVEEGGIACRRVGEVLPDGEGVSETREGRRVPLRRFARDEICRLF